MSFTGNEHFDIGSIRRSTANYEVSNRNTNSGCCFIEEENAKNPNDDSTQIRIAICQKEDETESENIYDESKHMR